MLPTLHLPVSTTWTSTQSFGTVGGAEFAKGDILFDRLGNKYMMCENTSGTAAVAGAPAYESSAVRGEVGKAADALGANVPLGAWMAATPASGFGFVMIAGFHTNLLGDGAVAAGEPIFATADTWDTATIGTHHVSGKSYEADDPNFSGRLIG